MSSRTLPLSQRYTLTHIIQKYGYILLLALSILLYVPGITSIPTTDVDEARFAQASKQMVETGNYLDIQFQDQPRYKKPIGIYWLQATSAKIAHYFGIPLNEIWPYRIPSLLAICASILLIYFYFSRLLPHKLAFFTAMSMASSLTLMVEARIAKTDAALFLCAIIMFGSLGLAYKNYKLNKAVKLSWLILFYGAMGVGGMIKGPVLPIMGIITVLSLRIIFKEKIFKPLKFPYLLIIPILINVPWLLWIQAKSQGLFLEESFIKDFWSKLIDFKRYIKTPPGVNTLSIPLVFGPSALLLLLSLGKIKHVRNHYLFPYLMSWFLPMFIVLELVPKKQPNYFLPLIPALYAMGIIALEKVKVLDQTKWAKFLFWASIIIYYIAFCSLLLLADLNFYETVLYLSVIVAGGILLWFGLTSYVKRKIALSLSMVAVLYSFLGFGIFFPRIEPIWITRHIKNKIGDAPSDKVVSLGYTYESLVFEVGTGTKRSHSLVQAKHYLEEGLGDIFIVRDAFVKDFEHYLKSKHIKYGITGHVSGYNLSKLRERYDLTIFVIQR